MYYLCIKRYLDGNITFHLLYQPGVGIQSVVIFLF